MSQVLSALIQTQLSAASPLVASDPLLLAQQTQLANAIAIAVQTYLMTNVTVAVVTPTGPGTGTLIAK